MTSKHTICDSNDKLHKGVLQIRLSRFQQDNKCLDVRFYPKQNYVMHQKHYNSFWTYRRGVPVQVSALSRVFCAQKVTGEETQTHQVTQLCDTIFYSKHLLLISFCLQPSAASLIVNPAVFQGASLHQSCQIFSSVWTWEQYRRGITCLEAKSSVSLRGCGAEKQLSRFTAGLSLLGPCRIYAPCRIKTGLGNNLLFLTNP